MEFLTNFEKSRKMHIFDIFWKWVFSFIYVAIGRTEVILQIGNILVGGPLAKIFFEISVSPPVTELNFHLSCRFLSNIHKITNFRQQKQQMLFFRNYTPKLCCQKFLGGDPRIDNLLNIPVMCGGGGAKNTVFANILFCSKYFAKNLSNAPYRSIVRPKLAVLAICKVQKKKARGQTILGGGGN